MLHRRPLRSPNHSAHPSPDSPERETHGTTSTPDFSRGTPIPSRKSPVKSFRLASMRASTPSSSTPSWSLSHRPLGLANQRAPSHLLLVSQPCMFVPARAQMHAVSVLPVRFRVLSFQLVWVLQPFASQVHWFSRALRQKEAQRPSFEASRSHADRLMAPLLVAP